MYWGTDNSFFHYDSSFGINRIAAQSLTQKLAPILATSSASTCQLEKGCMPRQTNGYDCGVYVIGAAELLCQALRQGGGRDRFHKLLQDQLPPEAAIGLRKRYLHIIEQKSMSQ